MSISQAETEFQIIQHYFKKHQSSSANILTGIGDDAAVIDITNQSRLVVSIDTLISGIHFPVNTNASDIAYKSLAVNLSDLAAMGATPAWFTLALTLAESDSEWLAAFSASLFDLASQYKLQLIGGDTTQARSPAGPCITIQIAGYVNDDLIMHRNTANQDDDIYVSGSIGDAGAGLLIMKELSAPSSDSNDYLINRLNRPTPRVKLGELLRKYASACIDISDGLLVDLEHITTASSCGAIVNVELLPISTALKTSQFSKNCYQLALDSGDDYELCFCVPKKYRNEIVNIANKLDITISKIGEIKEQSGIQCYFENQPYDHQVSGYQHFTEKTTSD